MPLKKLKKQDETLQNCLHIIHSETSLLLIAIVHLNVRMLSNCCYILYEHFAFESCGHCRYWKKIAKLYKLLVIAPFKNLQELNIFTIFSIS